VFKLYTEQKPTFPFVDYGMLVKEATGVKSALEFGPGISTLALIEAGVERIVTLEHDPIWFDKAVKQFKDYPQVEVRPYKDEPVVEADVEGKFDIAFVDSPKGFVHMVRGVEGSRKKHPGQEDCSRLNTCLFALKHAPIVYLHDAFRPLERGTLGRLNRMGHTVKFIPGHAGIAKIWRSPEPI
jgi:hypothetical protein